jgi:hypothetical protein
VELPRAVRAGRQEELSNSALDSISRGGPDRGRGPLSLLKIRLVSESVWQLKITGPLPDCTEEVTRAWIVSPSTPSRLILRLRSAPLRCSTARLTPLRAGARPGHPISGHPRPASAHRSRMAGFAPLIPPNLHEKGSAPPKVRLGEDRHQRGGRPRPSRRLAIEMPPARGPAGDRRHI